MKAMCNVFLKYGLYVLLCIKIVKVKLASISSTQ